jgi:folate-binding protein YgfZ
VADAAAEYELLRTGVVAVRLARDVVRVTGPDAVTFLQGQCSQDLAQVGVGDSAWSLVLQPQGKVEALMRATRVADDTFVLDVDGQWGQALVDRLNRFKLRVKADLEPLAWTCVALRGPGAAAAAEGVVSGPELLVVDAGWPGLPGLDLLGAGPHVPEGVAEISPAVYEVARIEAGIPRMGAELTDKTIPAEAGIVARTVSFTKGCFTGQELVARIDSRNSRIPRHLRGVVTPVDGVPVGAALQVAGERVGTLTSVAAAPGGGTVGLAYVSWKVEPPVEASAEWNDGRSTASIRALPLVT